MGASSRRERDYTVDWRFISLRMINAAVLLAVSSTNADSSEDTDQRPFGSTSLMGLKGRSQVGPARRARRVHPTQLDAWLKRPTRPAQSERA